MLKGKDIGGIMFARGLARIKGVVGIEDKTVNLVHRLGFSVGNDCQILDSHLNNVQIVMLNG